MRTRIAIMGGALLGATLLTGCSQNDDPDRTPSAPSDPKAAATLPADLVVEQLDGETVGPAQARKTAKPGDDVLLTGHIAGRKDPFVDGRAMFVLSDVSLPLCDDGCTAPWDLCCETPTDIAAGTATVQVVGTDGRPLPVTLRDHAGLTPGCRITVAGEVQQSDESVFVVNAKSIAILE